MLLFFSGLWCLPSPYSSPHVAHAPYCTVFHCRAPGCQIPAVEQAFVECTLCAHSPPSCVTGCQALGSNPILSWGPCSNPTRQLLDVCVLSHIRLFEAPWTVARQAPLSMKFLRQEDWSGLSFPTPGNLSDPGIEPKCLVSSALAGGFFTTSTTWEVLRWVLVFWYCRWGQCGLEGGSDLPIVQKSHLQWDIAFDMEQADICSVETRKQRSCHSWLWLVVDSFCSI